MRTYLPMAHTIHRHFIRSKIAPLLTHHTNDPHMSQHFARTHTPQHMTARIYMMHSHCTYMRTLMSHNNPNNPSYLDSLSAPELTPGVRADSFEILTDSVLSGADSE